MTSFFAWPRFTDAESGRKAELINILLWSLSGVAFLYMFFFLVVFPTPKPLSIALVFVTFFFVLGLQFPLRRGYVDQTALGLVWGLWVVVALANFAGGGMRSPAFYSFIIVVLIAGLLLDSRKTAVLTGLTLLVGVVTIYGDIRGWWPTFFDAPQRVWAAHTVLLIITAVLTRLTANNMYLAVRQHQVELAERVKVEQLLLLDMAEQTRREAWLRGQRDVLEMIAGRNPLPDILKRLLLVIEDQNEEMFCSILLLDADGVHLRHGAAPRLPAGYTQAIDGIAIGPSVGSCGTAAYLARPVVVRDIDTDPLWANYRELALSHHLRACWSTPIFDSHQKVLGTFAIYYSQPTSPTEPHLDLIQLATHTAAIAIERNQVDESLRLSEMRLSQIFNSVMNAIVTVDSQQKIVAFNPAAEKLFGYSASQIIGRPLSILIPDHFRQDHRKWFNEIDDPEVTNRVIDHFRQVEGLRADGTTFIAEVSISITEIMGQKNYTALLEDVTERLAAEKALRKSESRNRAFLEAIPDFIFLIDPDGRYLDFYMPDAIIATTFLNTGPKLQDAFSPPIAAQFLLLLNNVFGGAKMESLEFAISLPAEEKLFEARIVPVDENQAMLIAHDITRRHQREREMELVLAVSAALRTAESREQLLLAIVEELSTLLGVRSVAIALKDPITGETVVEEARGGFRRVRKSRLPAGVGVSGQVIATGRMFITDNVKAVPQFALTHLVDLDQAEIVLPLISQQECLGALLVGYERPITPIEVQLLTTISNIAANAIRRTMLHEQTQTQARRLSRILETIPDGLILLTRDYQIAACNQAAADYLAILTELLPGKPLTHLAGKPIYFLLRRPAAGKSHELTANGQVFEIRSHPISDTSTAEGWVLIIANVTESRQFQKQAQQQERLAAVGQMAAGIAHDFNNIMSVIVLYSQMLKHTVTLSAQHSDWIETVYHQAERATQLIQQILDFSRRSVMARSPIDLLPLIKELYKLWQRTLPENINLNLNFDQKEYIVNADPTRLQQALMNLVINARDAMPHGGDLQLSLTQYTLPQDYPPPLPNMPAGEWLLLAISDTGLGITSEALPHIFEPFFTTKPLGQGTGLGLAQVYGLIKQHDGYIGVTTRPGYGTTFTIYLPLLLSPKSPTQTTTPALPTPQNKNATILVVENERTVRQALRDTLELVGYQVITADNGQAAYDLFVQYPHPIDLVLSDVVMPELGGVELNLALKAINPTIKTIFMSGYPMGNRDEELLLGDSVIWLQKPFSIQTLIEKIAEML